MDDSLGDQSIEDPETIGMWAVRFRLSISHPLDSEEPRMRVKIGGRNATISCHRGARLKDTQGIVITVRGFPEENDAQNFAHQLRFGMLAAAAERGTGADVGENRATQSFARFLIEEWEKDGRTYLPDVHGIHIYKRSAPELLMIVSGHGTFLEPVNGFVDRLNLNFDHYDGHPTKALVALEMVARAGMAREPLSQAALYISAVEMLAARPWNKEQKSLIKSLKELAIAAEGLSQEDAIEVSKAIENTHKLVKQGIKRLMLDDLGMTVEEWEEFSKIYDLRSQILHGGAVSRATYTDLASQARAICARIVLLAVRIRPSA